MHACMYVWMYGKITNKQAKKTGKKVHVGKVFEICVEKGSESIPRKGINSVNLRGEPYSKGIMSKMKTQMLHYSQSSDLCQRQWKPARLLTHMGPSLGISHSTTTGSRHIHPGSHAGCGNMSRVTS